MQDRPKHDAGLDALLDLDGLVLVVDEKGEHWVKFEARQVAPTRERPHGLSYSLTLHGKNNERLVGFDNAHAVRNTAGPGGKGPTAFDHKHRAGTIRSYEYTEAAALLHGFLERGGCGAQGKRSTEMKTLRIGIASYAEMKARTLAIARGESNRSPATRRSGFPQPRVSYGYFRKRTGFCWPQSAIPNRGPCPIWPN